MSKILLTGSTGFLGRHIYKYLAGRTVDLVGLSRSGSSIKCDLNREIPVLNEKFDLVIHSAGLAHVEAPEELYYELNFRGTNRLLSGLEKNPPGRFVFISTVAVYGVEKGSQINEQATCVPLTPYGKSKLLAENAIIDWCNGRNIPYLILRLPLVIGKDAPGNWGAMSMAIQKGRYMRIKGNEARKSAVCAKDVANIIASWPGQSGIYNLTDGVHPLFSELEDALATYHKKPIRIQIPFWILYMGAGAGSVIRKLGLPFPLDLKRLKKITSTLTFSDQKARRELNWRPMPVIECIENLQNVD